MNLSAQSLELSRVILSSAGVGYFEWQATLLGEASLPLTVHLDQVDDVLKSLLILDPKGYPLGISLPGREPLTQTFKDLPFREGDLFDPVTLLNRLQGAEVEIQGMHPLQGRLLSVREEKVTLPHELGATIRHRVYLLTSEGLQQAILEDLDALRFLDRTLEGQVRKALSAIERHRAKGVRTLTLHFKGKGKRTVKVGYIAETPLWKASYRLDLGKRRLQGWAILENTSGKDWEDVTLTLTSGHPFSFRQALYRTYHVERPEVPVIPKPPPSPSPLRKPRLEEKALAALAPQRRPPLPQGKEEESLVYFTFPHPVTIENATSAMLPFLDEGLPMTPVAFYDAERHPIHPQSAVEIENATDITLPSAMVAVYGREGYLGDGRLPSFPPKDKALLTFALDTRIRIHQDEADERRIVLGSLRHGILHLIKVERAITRYRIEHFHARPRLLWIAHPHRVGWRLVKPQGAELKGNNYRLAVHLDPEVRELTLEAVLERPLEERLAVIDMDLDTLIAFARSTELPEGLRQAFAHVADVRRRMATHERALKRLEKEKAGVFEDQRRLRENLARIPRESDLFRRYLTKLEKQEDSLERLDKAMKTHREALEKLRRALEDYLENIAF